MTDKLMRGTATLYHKTGEDVDGKGLYERFVLRNVRFERKSSSLPVESGFRPYNSFKLYVNLNKSVGFTYADKTDYDALTPGARGRLWTAAENDFLTEGVTAFSLSDMTPDEIKNACEVYTVNSITRNGAGRIEILEISGRGRMLY